MNDALLIMDFGSQYTQLIARRVRELGVYCEIFPWNSAKAIEFAQKSKGIILSGGPESVTDKNPPFIPEKILAENKPILGICYGMQALTTYFDGIVSQSTKREFGYADVSIENDNKLFKNIDIDNLNVWMSHGDKVTALPEGFDVIAKSNNAPYAAMADEKRMIYGLQFHPEVTHTQFGAEILSAFAVDICGCATDWTPHNIAEVAIDDMRQKIGDDHVILGLSGGVDSSVVAALLHQAIGTQLTCIFVDTGLLRLNEGDMVMDMFADHMGVHVIRVNAEARYLKALENVTDPEKKRKIIGGLFVDIFEEEASKIDDAKYLAQGTIYPDVIESAGIENGQAHVIKSHHNVGGLPADMGLDLIEPLRFLFKDEVRRIGIELGLPEHMVYRHPFPGPGLGVRILGDIRKEYADLLRLADHIFIEELVNYDLYDKTSQAFAVFLPVKSVGVMGDGRCYDYVIALRAVETIDFMTARWANLPYDFLDHVSRRIVNEIKGISRVVYDISGKPPATIEWE